MRAIPNRPWVSTLCLHLCDPRLVRLISETSQLHLLKVLFDSPKLKMLRNEVIKCILFLCAGRHLSFKEKRVVLF